MPVSTKKRVTFDVLPGAAFRYLHYDAIVCMDVIRATTTLVTAVAQGRRAFPAANAGQARALGEGLENALIAGEGREDAPGLFEMGNSPSALALRSDFHRPLVLAGGGGTELIVNAAGCDAVYVTCLRNLNATAKALAERHRRVAVLAACSRGQNRCEDLMATAWLCERMAAFGFEPEDNRTAELLARWSKADISLVRLGSSAEKLRRSRQVQDLEFVLDHFDDLELVCVYREGELFKAAASAPPRAVAAGVRPDAVRALVGEHGPYVKI